MLGKRLGLCMDMIKEGSVVCDVGTDHGYLACELVKSGKCNTVVASDINEGPLSAAEKNVKLFGYEEQIPLILSDGLKKVCTSEYSKIINCIVIAGMGGETIVDILGSEKEFSSECELILQPMTKEYTLRKWLVENCFEIKEEKIAIEGRKIYTVLRAGYTGEKQSISEARLLMGFQDYSLEESKIYGQVQYNKYLKKYNGLKTQGTDVEEMNKNLEKMEKILNNEC